MVHCAGWSASWLLKLRVARCTVQLARLKSLRQDECGQPLLGASRIEGVAQEGISSNQLSIIMMELGPWGSTSSLMYCTTYRIASVVSCDV
ncbi:hypothetical protein CEP54_000662 [Fusarium duplospermum]|uniref:Uncharacterized protein n=1 Tax=Fusarium duplospermum TaxID=1325734 RepID=A0A428R536_9HYPO|nr:hypothetical protein CEP54_000662 [Fusarium duplospermum]